MTGADLASYGAAMLSLLAVLVVSVAVAPVVVRLLVRVW